MNVEFSIMIISFILLGCSGYMQETKRYHLPSNEGQVEFEEKVVGQKQALMDITIVWIDNYFNKETTVIQKKDMDKGLVQLKALAPVTGRSTEEYCHFELTATVADDFLKTYFKTLRMTDQFYPSRKNVEELRNYYKNLNNELKKALEKAKK